MSEELKPCPFCGRAPAVIDKTERRGKVTIYCGCCPVNPSVKGFTLKGTSIEWNTRATEVKQ